MKVHLVDGTYELFRHYYGAPAHRSAGNEEVGAARAVLGSLLGMLEAGATHMGVATDHVIESWRNDAWPTYKSSAGVPPDLLAQFPLFEEALASMGLVVWAMTDLEADDALASAAAVVPDDPRAEQVLICTPDKDLGQCVRGETVVCLDRRKNAIVDEEAVRARFGVGPASVPDWLALVGDSADGFPGVPGWGPKAASAVLGRYATLEAIPPAASAWEVPLPPSRVASLAAAPGARPGRRPAVQEAGHLRGRPGAPPHRHRRRRQPGMAGPGARVRRHMPAPGGAGIAEAG